MISKSTSLTTAENFSDKKAQKIIVNLIGLGILVNRYQSGSQSRDLDGSDLSLEQKNSISVFVLGVFPTFDLCVFLTLWCFSNFVMCFFTLLVFLTFVIFNDNCVFVFDFCSIF